MPKNDDERNAHPVYGQTEATEGNPSVCSLLSMLDGERRAHRNVGYKDTVTRFRMHRLSRCNQIRHDAASRTLKLKQGEVHEVFEPKYRITITSKYCDRVPQAAFVEHYFYPTVVPHLSARNCACLKGRGVDYARELFKQALRKAKQGDFVLKADMKSYFASIQHDKLLDEVLPFFDDEWATWFYRLNIDNASKPVGIDLGNEIFQLSAASFLNRLDHLMEGGGYIRYQDDIIFVGSKEQCMEVLSVIHAEADRLGLTLHPQKTFIQPICRPVKFLGFSFLRKPTGRVTMKRLPEKIRQERRKLRKMKSKGVPVERVLVHYQSVRDCLSKGARSDLRKLDDYFENLYHTKEGNNADHYKGRNCQTEKAEGRSSGKGRS